MINLGSLFYIFTQYRYYDYSSSRGMGLGWLGILVIYGIICAILCAIVAESKNKSQGLWGFLGFLFGIFALIAIAGISAEEKRGKLSKYCPRCLERIKKGAEVCPYCGFEFDEKDILNEVREIGKELNENYSLIPSFSAVFQRKNKNYVELYKEMLENELIPMLYYRKVLSIIVDYEKEKSFPFLVNLSVKKPSLQKEIVKAGKKVDIERFKKYVNERKEQEKKDKKILQILLKNLEKEEK